MATEQYKFISVYHFVKGGVVAIGYAIREESGQFTQLTLWNRYLYLLYSYSIGRVNCRSGLRSPVS